MKKVYILSIAILLIVTANVFCATINVSNSAQLISECAKTNHPPGTIIYLNSTSGTYEITGSALFINSPNIIIRGKGMDETSIKATSTNSFRVISCEAEGIKIENLEVDGKSIIQQAIRTNGHDNIEINGCRLVNVDYCIASSGNNSLDFNGLKCNNTIFYKYKTRAILFNRATANYLTSMPGIEFNGCTFVGKDNIGTTERYRGISFDAGNDGLTRSPIDLGGLKISNCSF